MTPERLQRLRATLDRRQPDLTVLADHVHKPHNLSAIIRTCDAVGIGDIQIALYGRDQTRFRARSGTAMGSDQWVNVTVLDDIRAAIEGLQASGANVVAAHLAPGAVSYREVDFTQPTALLLGAERDGVSEAVSSMVDQPITIPMMGMVQSYNVSVAAAIILAEAQHQRQVAGLYDACRLPEAQYRATLFEWAHPKVADYCKRHGLPYPAMDEQGSVDPAFNAHRSPELGAQP